MVNSFKKGDWAVCQENLNNYWYKGKIFQISSADNEYLNAKEGGSLYAKRCRLATNEEIPEEFRKQKELNLIIW